MRFLKVAGEMGPKTVKALADMVGKIKSVKLGEAYPLEVSEDGIRAACGNSNGPLVLYSDSPNVQCMTKVSAFCHQIGLETWCGDTLTSNPKSYGENRRVRFVDTDPVDLMEKTLLHQPVRKNAKKKVCVALLMKPENLAEYTPNERKAFSLSIERANALDLEDLHDFKNEVENRAGRLKKGSRKLVLQYMDKLAAKDLTLVRETTAQL